MASAHTTRSAARAVSRARAPGSRRVDRRGIRWDRVGRVTLLFLLGGVLALYVGPARAWYSAWHEARQWRADVGALTAENARLAQRRRALELPTALEREARRLGMVRSGERAYAISGLSREP